MKKSIYLLSALAVAATLASCRDELRSSFGEQGYTTITAVMAEPGTETRTCVDMSDVGHGYLGLLWNPGDSIAVFSKEGDSNVPFKSTTQTNTPKSTFVGKLSKGEAAYAYYPFNPENAGADVTDLKGRVEEEQPFELSSGKLTCDYKYGAPVREGSAEFSFQHLFTLLEIDINATATPLEGEKLDYIELTVTDPAGNPRAIGGDFHFNATDGTWWNVTNTVSTIRMPWTDTPELANGANYTGFISVLPNVKVGDILKITVASGSHKATFTATSKLDFKGGNAHCLPLNLEMIAKDPKYGMDVKELPTISDFRFMVADNAGKLLDNKTVWNSSNNPEFQTVKEHVAEIKINDIDLTIPYLYDFKLKPTFTAAAGLTVKCGDQLMESGKTEIDFSRPVTITVSNGEDTRKYKVNVTNTGLPVVVIKQSGSGDFSDEKEGGFLGMGGTVVNKFVNVKLRGKNTEWVDDDQMTVYNANGTIDMPTANCGIRLRGNTSKGYPKKPLAIKMAAKQTVLGMPAHKRWVLLANWLDHSMMRNTVAFDIAHAIENAWKSGDIEQGIPWNVHGYNVELVIDGHHVGNYYLCEQIKIGGKRLKIQDAYEDVLASGVTPAFENCGYLLELDNNYDEVYKFKTSKVQMPINLKDALPDTQIFNQVKAKVDKIEGYLASGDYATAYELLDINTVIDQWIIWEITQNREYTEPRSVYYYMDGDKKLCAGPVWDFDRATFQNTTKAAAMGNSKRIKKYDEWVYWPNGEGGQLMSTWMEYLFKDPNFCKRVQERWTAMYPYLQGVVADIRRHGAELKKSYAYDSAMWPTNKTAITKHKSGFTDWSGDEEINDHDELVKNFEEVYLMRLEGMNSLITNGKFTK